jgi:hypothetical protein
VTKLSIALAILALTACSASSANVLPRVRGASPVTSPSVSDAGVALSGNEGLVTGRFLAVGGPAGVPPGTSEGTFTYDWATG